MVGLGHCLLLTAPACRLLVCRWQDGSDEKPITVLTCSRCLFRPPPHCMQVAWQRREASSRDGLAHAGLLKSSRLGGRGMVTC